MRARTARDASTATSEQVESVREAGGPAPARACSGASLRAAARVHGLAVGETATCAHGDIVILTPAKSPRPKRRSAYRMGRPMLCVCRAQPAGVNELRIRTTSPLLMCVDAKENEAM
jgi:hypothetical protein